MPKRKPRHARSQPRTALPAAVDDSPQAFRALPILAADKVTILRPPTATVSEWIDPEDANPNRRQAKKVRGYRASDPVGEMHARGAIPARFVRTFRRFQRDWEIGLEGASPGGGKEIGMPATKPGKPPPPPTHRLDAVTRVNAALQAVGAIGSAVLIHVAGGNSATRDSNSIIAYARAAGRDERMVSGMLIAALDRLADFYEPPERSIVDEILEEMEKSA